MSRRPPMMPLAVLLAWIAWMILLEAAPFPAFAGQAADQNSNPVLTGRILPDQTERSTIDVTEFQISPKALAEFHKGDDALKRQEWAKAVERYQKAIGIDPKFVEAFNNMAYAYARMGDREHQRAALDQAIALNRHAVQPLMNRALVAFQDNDKAAAENFLARATKLDPQNSEALVLLTRAQLMNAHYDDALATVRQLDASPHAKYALIHYLAARAFEAERKFAEAAAQLREFLQEEPQGARADAARKELAQLEATIVLQ